MTAERFKEIRNGSEPEPHEVAEYERNLKAKLRSEAAFRAVRARRERYSRGSSRRNDHHPKE